MDESITEVTDTGAANTSDIKDQLSTIVGTELYLTKESAVLAAICLILASGSSWVAYGIINSQQTNAWAVVIFSTFFIIMGFVSLFVAVISFVNGFAGFTRFKLYQAELTKQHIESL
jgi:drug/metabolite transporter (DMT)-like permease